MYYVCCGDEDVVQPNIPYIPDVMRENIRGAWDLATSIHHYPQTYPFINIVNISVFFCIVNIFYCFWVDKHNHKHIQCV